MKRSTQAKIDQMIDDEAREVNAQLAIDDLAWNLYLAGREERFDYVVQNLCRSYKEEITLIDGLSMHFPLIKFSLIDTILIRKPKYSRHLNHRIQNDFLTYCASNGLLIERFKFELS